tara:strand:+ start:7460 stop:7912 length:453 start_codon:yes stop_codon:yes gene_type:complete
MPSSSILFFASGSFKNLRVYRSDLPSLRRYSRGSKDVSLVFAAPAARTLVEIFVGVIVVLLLLVAAIIFIVIEDVPRPSKREEEEVVERAEDAALLLLLLEQGIDDNDNIIPNAVVVPLISFFRLKNKRVLTASKSSSGKWRRGIGLSFF